MNYVPLTATKMLLSELYHESQWENVDSNIALWELFYKSYGFNLSAFEKDVEVLEMYTTSDLSFFVNAHAKAALAKLESHYANMWLSEYKKWVFSKLV